MLDDERILTKHPAGKRGVNILKSKYDFISKNMLKLIKKHKAIAWSDLAEIMEETLSDKFDGKIIWYVVSVKLDLEARGIIERISKTSPHQLRLKK